MSIWTRRRAVFSAAALSAVPFALQNTTAGGEASRREARDLPGRALVRVTDLFRRHDDPDDHWDLATA